MEKDTDSNGEDHINESLPYTAPHWLVNKIRMMNPEYSRRDILSMAETAVWENPKLSSRGVYLSILNRVLEEKGFEYRGNATTKPLVNVESDGRAPVTLGGPDYQVLVNELFINAKLTQKEIFILSLSFGLSTPNALSGEYKETLDSMEDLYYFRPLKRREVAKIANIATPEVSKICKQAIGKINENR